MLLELSASKESKYSETTDFIQAAFHKGASMCIRLCGLLVRVSGYRSRGPGSLFPALPDFLRSSGFGTEFTQPREYN
jgi:hypothetical protein